MKAARKPDPRKRHPNKISIEPEVQWGPDSAGRSPWHFEQVCTVQDLSRVSATLVGPAGFLIAMPLFSSVRHSENHA